MRTRILLLCLLISAPLWGVTYTLLDGATANGSGTGRAWPQRSSFACGTIDVFGTFDGATVTLEHSADGIVWRDFLDENAVAVTWTDDTPKNICASTRVLRLTISDAGASTDLDATIGS